MDRQILVFPAVAAAWLALALGDAGTGFTRVRTGGHMPPGGPATAVPNDNRTVAGRVANGVLTLRLEACEVVWYPDGEPGVAVPVYAFAEAGRPARVPGPLIRVTAGTEIRATVRNALPLPLTLRGLQARTGAALDSIIIPPGGSHELRFRADVPGTYYYWGRTLVYPPTAILGSQRDAPLLGAFIVDSAGSPPPRGERILVLTTWSDTIAGLGPKTDYADRVLRREMFPRDRWFTAAINGRSWPHTERLSYAVGDTVRFRVINGSRAPHPMHLHGFYFDVTARGDAARDTVFSAAQRRQAVTEWLITGATMSMTWVPTRPGNWLFHCHIVQHISDALRLGAPARSSTAHRSHAEQGMAGLVMGIRIAPDHRPAAPEGSPRRRLRLFVTERANVYGDRPGYSYVLQEGPLPPARDSIRTLSSTLILSQNEPTEITVVNTTRQGATIHWHGLELESFYDGVGDWSGWGERVAPPIAPEDSFVVRLTPPRAGTFIYHTHTNEGILLASGLYGALLVLPEGAQPDTTERLFVLGMDGPLDVGRPAINGAPTQPPIELRAGVAHRFRFISIAPLESRTVQLLAGGEPRPWRPLAKDGADLPAYQATSQAGAVSLHPGETYDVEILRQRPETLTLKFIAPETITNRFAFLARANPREPVPRIVVEIPVIIR